ncbi:MAG: hypothetical protein QF767_05825 [Alphaproteobacteria bacterium]|nr:hypothetical protein [Alphaproteobacteria bacterium]
MAFDESPAGRDDIGCRGLNFERSGFGAKQCNALSLDHPPQVVGPERRIEVKNTAVEKYTLIVIRILMVIGVWRCGPEMLAAAFCLRDIADFEFPLRPFSFKVRMYPFKVFQILCAAYSGSNGQNIDVADVFAESPIRDRAVQIDTQQ